MIDLHCHLDLYSDALKLLPTVVARNVFTLVVTTSPRAWQATSQVFADYDNIKVAVGLHPEVVAKKENERALLISCISRSRFIGEVGLDGSRRYQETMPLQESILNEVLTECERVGGRILSIHSRNAASRVLDLVEKHCRESTPVLHWFSGTVQEVRRAVALGCWFSVNPLIVKGKKGRDLISKIPQNLILPESDGPFATHNNKPIMPWEAVHICDDLSEIWHMPVMEIKEQMKNNLHNLLNDA